MGFMPEAGADETPWVDRRATNHHSVAKHGEDFQKKKPREHHRLFERFYIIIFRTYFRST